MQVGDEDRIESSRTTTQLAHCVLHPLAAIDEEKLIAHLKDLSAGVVLEGGFRTSAA